MPNYSVAAPASPQLECRGCRPTPPSFVASSFMPHPLAARPGTIEAGQHAGPAVCTRLLGGQLPSRTAPSCMRGARAGQAAWRSNSPTAASPFAWQAHALPSCGARTPPMAWRSLAVA
jgi:hypothetical protein